MTQQTEKVEKTTPGVIFASFFTGLRFLTVLPISWRAADDKLLFASAIYSFAPIGLLIGGCGALLTMIVSLHLPPAVTAIILVCYLAAISGFLHLDGLADSADGLLSHRGSEQSLAIMRDSRTGAMAVVVLVLVLLGKYAALCSLGGTTLIYAVLLMPLAGRCAIVITMGTQEYARNTEGLGALFYSSRAKTAGIVAVLLLFGVATLLLGALQALLICILIYSLTLLFGYFCKNRIGGITGDTLGAVCEMSELTMAFALAAIY